MAALLYSMLRSLIHSTAARARVQKRVEQDLLEATPIGVDEQGEPIYRRAQQGYVRQLHFTHIFNPFSVSRSEGRKVLHQVVPG